MKPKSFNTESPTTPSIEPTAEVINLEQARPNTNTQREREAERYRREAEKREASGLIQDLTRTLNSLTPEDQVALHSELLRLHNLINSHLDQTQHLPTKPPTDVLKLHPN